MIQELVMMVIMITMMIMMMNKMILSHCSDCRMTLQHSSSTLSHEYLIIILLLLLFVILLPPRFPQCSQSRRIAPQISSPLQYKVPDKADPDRGFSIQKVIVGKYLFIASKIGNLNMDIENHNADVEGDITEIN